MSHPVWVRGLKLDYQDTKEEHLQSHPVWVRGLKQERIDQLQWELDVAPRVGAWIETLCHYP